MSNTGKSELSLSAQDALMQTENSMSVDEYLAQLHADYDPVYSLLMNYQCAVMEVETKFNILNNRLSLQGPRVPNRPPWFPTSTPPPGPSAHPSGFSIRSQQDSASFNPRLSRLPFIPPSPRSSIPESTHIIP